MCGTSLVLLFSSKHESMLHLKNFCSRTKNNLFLGRKDEEMVIMTLPGVVQVHTGGNQAMLIYMYISVSLLCLSQWENIFKARWEVHSYWEFIHDNATTSSAYYHHFSCTNREKKKILRFRDLIFSQLHAATIWLIGESPHSYMYERLVPTRISGLKALNFQYCFVEALR